MEITSGDYRRITVSGTASIELGRKTAHLGDIPAQIELAVKVIEEILHSEGMDSNDTVRAFAYCKEASTAHPFSESSQKHSQTQMPVIPIQCDICRHDLLFELELDAIQPVQPN